ncbi:hypothetical protein IE53DRAFT_389061 [Violaceomyces palustris]|uniref:Uncharacterized protein n=1 Tax=Violaceomyces palustris TaxID=1673888 RepID=A0ACD0NSE0_9BASI|nr:hypothetical protein IE53DRAFT_389061 [Violaceomyces palustris]
MSGSWYPPKRDPKQEQGVTDFDLLKRSNRFLPVQDDRSVSNPTEEYSRRMAIKYHSELYKDFVICDLKRFKSGGARLRWRTEEEVLGGIGKETCSNLRCPYHRHARGRSWTKGSVGEEEGWKAEDRQGGGGHGDGGGPRSSWDEEDLEGKGRLETFEVNFSYLEPREGGEEEVGEVVGDMVSRNALVHVVLCTRCGKKLNWKRRMEKRRKEEEEEEGERETKRRGKGTEHGRGSERERERRKGRGRRSEERRSRSRSRRDASRGEDFDRTGREESDKDRRRKKRKGDGEERVWSERREEDAQDSKSGFVVSQRGKVGTKKEGDGERPREAEKRWTLG